MKVAFTTITSFAIGASAMVFAPQLADAALIQSYFAGEKPTVPNAPNPGLQGWSASGGVTTGAGQGDDSPNTNYWQILDNTGAASMSYSRNLTAGDLTDSEGWTATARVRVVTSSTTIASSFFEVGNGSKRFLILFTKSGATNELHYYNASATGTKLADFTFNSPGSDLFQLNYKPSDPANVGVYANGNFVGNIPVANALAGTFSWIRFGSGSTPGTSDTHWNTVTFETGNTVVPEPTIIGLLIPAAALVLRRRRTM